MDFELNESSKMMRDNARKFLLKEIAPLVNEFEKRPGRFTHDEIVEFNKKLIPLGYLNGSIGTEFGGMGLSYLDQGILMEELWRVWGSLGGVMFTNSAPMLIWGAPDHVKKIYEDRVRKGELIIATGLTEPNHGSDLAGLETNAVGSGNDFIINGNKIWCSQGGVADAIITMCVDKTMDPPGVTTILVPKEAGYTFRDVGHIGLKCLNTAEVWYSDVRVPQDWVVVPGMAYKRYILGFETGRSMIACEAVGLAQAAIDASITYAKQRVCFGRPIAGFQMVQNQIVDMIADTEASRFLAYRALTLIDKDVRCRWESSLAKYWATEHAIWTCSKAIEVHGGIGLSDDFPVERFFRDARMLTHPDGAVNIQKLVVGREILGINAIK